MSMNKVSGKIFHTDGEPFRHVAVEVWDRDVLMEDRMATGETDDNGVFSITYDSSKAGWRDLPDLRLKVLQPNSKGELSVIHEQDGPDDVTGDHDFGEIIIAHWEYDPSLILEPVIVRDEICY